MPRPWSRTGVEPLYQVLRAQPAAHYGRPTAEKLAALARAEREQWASKSRTLNESTDSDADQLEHTQVNLTRLNALD